MANLKGIFSFLKRGAGGEGAGGRPGDNGGLDYLGSMFGIEAQKTSDGYGDLPSDDLRAKSISKTERKSLERKKKKAASYFIDTEKADIFDEQTKEMIRGIDEKKILRNKDIDIMNLGEFYRGLNYNDIQPLGRKKLVK